MLCTVISTLLLTAAAETQQPHTTLKLQRSSIQLEEGGRTKNFYFAKVAVGEPAQKFRVAFDLGGGTTVLPSSTCRSLACGKRRLYDKDSSDTAEDIQADGRLVDPERKRVPLRTKGRQGGSLSTWSTDLGSGTVKGAFVRDRVCVGEDENPNCFPLGLIVARTLTDLPFYLEPYDGTVGLGLEGLSMGPQFNFLNALIGNEQLKLANSFALHLGGEYGGEISFGGYDVNQLSSPLEWVTVAEPENGRWQVAITAVRVGNNTLQACREGACRAALDYGSSLLNVPSQLASSMEKALEDLSTPGGYGDGCQATAMPDLQLELNGGVTITLPAEDYATQVKPSTEKGIMTGPARSCKPSLAQHEFSDSSVDGLFVLGEAVMRRYYTIFDGDALKIGFSLATGPKKALPPMLEAGKGKEWMDAELDAADDEEDGKRVQDNPVILLVQVKLRRSKTVSSLGQ